MIYTLSRENKFYLISSGLTAKETRVSPATHRVKLCEYWPIFGHSLYLNKKAATRIKKLSPLGDFMYREKTEENFRPNEITQARRNDVSSRFIVLYISVTHISGQRYLGSHNVPRNVLRHILVFSTFTF